MNKLVGTLSVLALSAIPNPAAAALFICQGRPATYLGIGGDGTVFTDIVGVGVSQVCNLTSTSGTITPQACAAWYSTLLTQRAAGRTVLIHYNDPTVTSCGEYEAWGPTRAYYLLTE